MWKFNTTTTDLWKDFNNHKVFVEKLGKQLGIKKLEDWYKVRARDFSENGGSKFT